jgi:DNA-binding GntR family transcriptional regulator
MEERAVPVARQRELEMELTRLKRERAADAVHQALRQAILSSLLRPGERLHMNELAQKLGVSLTPVRHAIQLLAKEGLVEVKPRSGTFVASVTAEDVRETFELRCALECMAVEKAAERIRPPDLQRLKALVKAMRAPIRNETDQALHEENNREFHLILLRAAENRRLLETYDALNANIKIARIHAADADWTRRLDQEQDEHEAIVKALEQKRTAAAVRAMRRHILRAMGSLIEAIEGKSASHRSPVGSRGPD